MTTTAAPPHIGSGYGEPAPDCPYVGLLPFGEQQASFFFGRERESEILAANLAAARLTLLYAQSGVGKSSVLQAGVIPRLRRLAMEEEDDEYDQVALTTIAIAYVSDWSSAPLESLAAAIRQAVAATTGIEPDQPAAPSRFGLDWLRSVLDEAGIAVLHLVLDQFEEYFFYHPADSDAGGLPLELGEILTARDVNVHVLLSIREDAIADLDRFKGRVPQLFGNYLRLSHLTRDAARSAIAGPLAEFNRRVHHDQAMSIDPGLVEDILDQVRTGNVVVDRDGAPSDAVSADERGDIETPYLQLVMTRIWEEERAESSNHLRHETLAKLGGAQTIVQSHLDTVVAGLTEQQVAVAAAVFHHLVTASGSKIALTAADLAEWSGQPVDDVRDLLERLSSGRRRILRPVPPVAGALGPPRYEIFHDVMGAAVLDWRRRYVAEMRHAERSRQLIAEREQARAAARTARRRLRYTVLTLGLIMVLLIASATLGVVTFHSLQTTQQQALLADSTAALDRNPELGLATAAAAYRLGDNAESRSAVLVAASMLRGEVVAGPSAADGGTGLLDLEVTADGAYVVGYDRRGRVIILDQAGARRADVQVTGFAGDVVDVTLASDATHLAAATDGNEIVIVDVTSGRQVELSTGMTAGMDLSWLGSGLDGSVLAVGPDNTATIFDAATGAEVWRSPGEVYTATGIDGGRHVVTWESDNRMHVWSTADGTRIAESTELATPIWTLGEWESAVVGIAFPDEERGQIVSWDWRGDPATVQHSFAHDNLISAVAIDEANDIAIIASGTEVLGYNVTDGTEAFHLPQQADWVNDVAVSKDRQWMATAGVDGRVLMWHIGVDTIPVLPTYELLGDGGVVSRVAFLGGTIVALELNGTLRKWDLPQHARFDGHSDWALALDLSDDGRLLATAGSDGYGYILDPTDVRTRIAKFGDGTPLFEIYFDPTDPYYLVGLEDWAVAPRAWRWSGDGSSQEAVDFDDLSLPYDHALVDVSISPDGTTVAGIDSMGDLYFWDSRTGRLIPDRTHPGKRTLITGSITYDPTGQLIATTGSDGVRLIDIAGGTERMLPHPNALGVAFAPSGERLASVADGGTVAVWSHEGERSRSFVAHSNRLGDLTFSKDGSLLAVGSGEGLVEVWDIRSGVTVMLTRQHGDFVNDVLFAPGAGDELISASDDTTVARWSCAACTDQEAVIQAAVRSVQPR